MSIPSEDDERERVLLKLATENTQILVNSLFSLPKSSEEEGVAVSLPPKQLILPRMKPLPSSIKKPKTKWESFALKKGIKPRAKRPSHVFDESSKGWKPRHGSKSAKNHPLHNWVEELD